MMQCQSGDKLNTLSFGYCKFLRSEGNHEFELWMEDERAVANRVGERRSAGLCVNIDVWVINYADRSVIHPPPHSTPTVRLKLAKQFIAFDNKDKA
jgi:hypothetical protein